MPRRPAKKRKLSIASNTTDATCVPPRTSLSPDVFPSSFAVASEEGGAAAMTTDMSWSCISCHHSLLGKQNHVVICPRCRATSCSICSRICTAVPASLPPTPLLSYSPSPPGTPYLSSSNGCINCNCNNGNNNSNNYNNLNDVNCIACSSCSETPPPSIFDQFSGSAGGASNGSRGGNLSGTGTGIIGTEGIDRHQHHQHQNQHHHQGHHQHHQHQHHHPHQPVQGSSHSSDQVQHLFAPLRRRKHRDEEDDEDEGTVVGTEDDDGTGSTFTPGFGFGSGLATKTSMGTGASAGAGTNMRIRVRSKGKFGDDEDASPGCGRSVCKNCCIENTQSGITTCYDCYGLPPPLQIVESDSMSSESYSNLSSNTSSTLSLLIQ